MMKRLTEYFLKGLLLFVPLFASVYIVVVLFLKIEQLMRFPVPGVGVVVLFAGITLIGMLGSNFLTRRLVRWVDKVFEKLPLVKIIYSAVKDLLNAFVGDKKGFDRPVYVQLDKSVGVLGFVTNEDLSALGLEGKVVVYLPQSYNFAGNLVVVSKKVVTPLPVDSGETIKFILAGGTGEVTPRVQVSERD